MRIFKHRSFKQWAKIEGISDKILKKVIIDIEKGLHEGNLGSGLYKKRVGLSGRGKSGSHRILVAFRKEKNAFFVYGFAKNEKDNIDEKEEKIYRRLSKNFLDMDEDAINEMLEENKLFEVK